MFGNISYSTRVFYFFLIMFITFAFASPIEFKNHWIVFAGLTGFLMIINSLFFGSDQFVYEPDNKNWMQKQTSY